MSKKKKHSKRRPGDSSASGRSSSGDLGSNRQSSGLGRGKWLIAGVAALLIVAFGILKLPQGRPLPTALDDFDEAVSVEPPGTGYAGPAAFSITNAPAALSPDGRLTAWASGGQDLVVCPGVFSASVDLTQRTTIGFHQATIRAVTFANFGQSLASSDERGNVKVWDAASGQMIVELEGHRGAVSALAFAPDGVSMASGGEDETIRLWDAYGGLPLATLEGHEAEVTAVGYSPSGQRLASASEDGTIKIWDMETGRLERSIAVGDAAPISLLFSPTQPVLVSSDGGPVLRFWDVDTGVESRRLALPQSDILSAAFSARGDTIAVAGIDGQVIVESVGDGKRLADVDAAETPLFLQFLDDGSLRWSRLRETHLADLKITELTARLALVNREADSAIAGFAIADGVDVELFADESQVANPAALCSDERAAIYVAESFRYDTEVALGYAGRDFWLLDDLANRTVADRLAMYRRYADRNPQGFAIHSKYAERIRCLTDENQDGRADRSTLFANEFRTPLTGTGTGLLYGDGAVYYTCIPDLWKLIDEDDDGVAEKKQVLQTGFGVNASLPHGLHGLTWGPTGKLYFSVGDRGYDLRTSEGVTLQLTGVGAILRCNPDGTEMEEVARGFRNPQDLAFDDYGNLFTCDNNSNLGDEARLVYVLEGGDSGWRMAYETMPAEFPLGPWNLDQLWQTADANDAAWVVPPVAHIGAGPAGFVHYPGQGLPARYQNHFFLCDFADTPEASGIRSFAIEPAGGGFSVVDQHTFWSRILATDIEFAVDGKMYVADWIQGPEGNGLGRIYTAREPEAASDRDANLRQLFADGFEVQTDQRLLELLSHPDRRVRQQSQFELAGRGDSVREELIAAAASGNTNARLHSLWALEMIHRNEPFSLHPIRPLLVDPEAVVRVQAARLLGNRRDAESVSVLVDALDDESLHVRASAAEALGRIGEKSAAEPLLESLRDDDGDDPYLRHAVVYAVYRLGEADLVERWIDDDHPAVRMAALLTLRRHQDARLATFLTDAEPSIRTEAARAIHDLRIQPAMAQLAASLADDPANESWVRRAINANYLVGGVEQAETLIAYIDDERSPEKLRRLAVRAVGDWIDPPVRDPVLGSIFAPNDRDPTAVATVIERWLSKHLASAGSPLEEPLIEAALKLDLAVGDPSWVADGRRSVVFRQRLLDGLVEQQSPQAREAIETALDSDSGVLRIHAAGLLSKIDRERASQALQAIIADGETGERQFAFQQIADIPSAELDELLVDWLRRIPRGEVPAAIKFDILDAANRRSDTQVQQALASVVQYLAQQPTVAGKYQAVLEGGSAERGRQIFEFHTAVQCMRCHAVDGQGGEVGPDLTQIGSKFSREYLLESLLMPAAKIAEGYESVSVITDDGRVISGTLKDENDQHLTLVDANNQQQTIAIDRITHRQGGRSAMPDNLLQHLSSRDLRDLVEYLASLKQ